MSSNSSIEPSNHQNHHGQPQNQGGFSWEVCQIRGKIRQETSQDQGNWAFFYKLKKNQCWRKRRRLLSPCYNFHPELRVRAQFWLIIREFVETFISFWFDPSQRTPFFKVSLLSSGINVIENESHSQDTLIQRIILMLKWRDLENNKFVIVLNRMIYQVLHLSSHTWVTFDKIDQWPQFRGNITF